MLSKLIGVALVVGVAFLAGARIANARDLSLGEAVALGMRVDPMVAEARIAQDRSKLAVLLSQLDRVSLKVDGQLQEQWNKTNIGGPRPAPIGCSLSDVALTSCTMAGGTVLYPDSEPSAGLGLFNLSANATVPVFSGLRVESNVSLKQRLERAATASLRQSRKDTAISVARAYWSVRRVSLLRDVQQRALSRMREAEVVTASRVKAGLAPPIDQNRATVRRLQQEATLADLDGQYRQAAAQLAVALEISEDVELTETAEVVEGMPRPVAELLADAKSGRPEIAIARLQSEAQRFATRMARSNYFPQLSAFGVLQYGNNPFIPGEGAYAVNTSANPFTNLAMNITLGATLSMNFFDTLNTYTNTRDAKYEEARLHEEQRRVGKVVDANVRVAHAHLIQLFDQRTPLLQAREVANDNLKILEARYKNGDALVIEFLDAQVDLANAELNLADVTAQLKLAWLELEAALGKTVGAES